MLRLAQPAFMLFVGAAMLIYGLHHAAIHAPAREVLDAVWSAMPAIAAIALFVLGLLVSAAGLTLLVTGGLGLRRRYRQLRRFVVRHVPDDEDDEPDYQRGYRYA